MSDNDREDVIRRAQAAGKALHTGRVNVADVGPELVMLCHDQDRGVVVDLGEDIPIAYLAPYNGTHITFTVPTGDADGEGPE